MDQIAKGDHDVHPKKKGLRLQMWPGLTANGRGSQPVKAAREDKRDTVLACRGRSCSKTRLDTDEKVRVWYRGVVDALRAVSPVVS
jgi:hypothetical protein